MAPHQGEQGRLPKIACRGACNGASARLYVMSLGRSPNTSGAPVAKAPMYASCSPL